MKKDLLGREENPFRKLFIVDVDVTEVGGKPVLYKVLEVKDSFEREED